MLMKKMLFTFALMALPLFALKATAQEGIFVNYEETMPEYPGGERQWKKDRDTYMETRLKNMFPQANPDSLATDERKRRIVVQCIIDKEGIAQDPIILPGHGLHPTIDEAVINYVHQMPRFKPGGIKGEPRNVKYVMPFFVHPYYLRLLEREEQQSTDTTIYEVVEKMPEYPGGIKVLVRDAQVFAQKYIKKHFPDDKTNPYWWPGCGIPARSIVTFTVHEDGQITDAIITRNVDPHCDRAALLFVKSMPRWIPGEQKGKKVKVKFTLPFSLHLQ